jgi:hypothetical protein
MNRATALSCSIRWRWWGRLSAACVGLLLGTACAQPSPPAAAPSAPVAPAEAAAMDRDVSAAFREADKNGDGQLNREEARILPAVLEQFDRIDTNGDQHISLDELAKALHP